MREALKMAARWIERNLVPQSELDIFDVGLAAFDAISLTGDEMVKDCVSEYWREHDLWLMRHNKVVDQYEVCRQDPGAGCGNFTEKWSYKNSNEAEACLCWARDNACIRAVLAVVERRLRER